MTSSTAWGERRGAGTEMTEARCPANTIINKAIDLRTVDTSWMDTGMAYNMNRQESGE